MSKKLKFQLPMFKSKIIFATVFCFLFNSIINAQVRCIDSLVIFESKLFIYSNDGIRFDTRIKNNNAIIKSPRFNCSFNVSGNLANKLHSAKEIGELALNQDNYNYGEPFINVIGYLIADSVKVLYVYFFDNNASVYETVSRKGLISEDFCIHNNQTLFIYFLRRKF